MKLPYPPGLTSFQPLPRDIENDVGKKEDPLREISDKDQRGNPTERNKPQ